jgi:hypothetical protein
MYEWSMFMASILAAFLVGYILAWAIDEWRNRR